MKGNCADTHSLYSPRPPWRAIVIAVRHYAAYGSNLDPGRMRAYCPHSPMVGVGWLEGWRLTFGGEEGLGGGGGGGGGGGWGAGVRGGAAGGGGGRPPPLGRPPRPRVLRRALRRPPR